MLDLSTENQELKYEGYLEDNKNHFRISQYFKKMLFFKVGNLERRLQFSASLLNLLSTITSSETHNSIFNIPFVTLRCSTNMFMFKKLHLGY